MRRQEEELFRTADSERTNHRRGMRRRLLQIGPASPASAMAGCAEHNLFSGAAREQHLEPALGVSISAREPPCLRPYGGAAPFSRLRDGCVHVRFMAEQYDFRQEMTGFMDRGAPNFARGSVFL